MRELEPWLRNLHDLKTRSGMSGKQIAEKVNMSEKAVSRIFTGEAKNPGVEPTRKIIHALGGSVSDIFAETGAVIGGQDLAALQEEVDRLRTERDKLAEENRALKRQVDDLKDELLDTHRYYSIKQKQS